MSVERLDEEPEYIVSAAIEVKKIPYTTDGNHHDIGVPRSGDVCEGYMTNKGRFLNRWEAFLLARENDQLIPGTMSALDGMLYSADFWEWGVLQMRKKLFPEKERV